MRTGIMTFLLVLGLSNDVQANDDEMTCRECCGATVSSLCLPPCSIGCLKLLREFICDAQLQRLPDDHYSCLPENRVGYAQAGIYFGTAMMFFCAGRLIDDSSNVRANAQIVFRKLGAEAAAPFVFLRNALKKQKME